MDRDESLVRETALADAYALLALLVDFPTQALAEGLCSGAVQRDAAGIGREAGLLGAWAAGEGFAPAEDAPALLKALRVEHTRLFEHPEHPTVFPYEALFLFEEGRAASAACPEGGRAPRKGLYPGKVLGASGLTAGNGGRSTAPVPREMFDERPRMFVNPAALDAERIYRAAGLARSDAKNVPADSIVTELQFASHLHGKIARALHAEDAPGLEAARALQEEFMRLHLHKWAKPFFEKTSREARADAYRWIGELGAELCAAL